MCLTFFHFAQIEILHSHEVKVQKGSSGELQIFYGLSKQNYYALNVLCPNRLLSLDTHFPAGASVLKYSWTLGCMRPRWQMLVMVTRGNFEGDIQLWFCHKLSVFLWTCSTTIRFCHYEYSWQPSYLFQHNEWISLKLWAKINIFFIKLFVLAILSQ